MNMYIQQPLCGEGLGTKPFHYVGKDGCTASTFTVSFFKIPLENVISGGLKFHVILEGLRFKIFHGRGHTPVPPSMTCAKHTSLYIPLPPIVINIPLLPPLH